MCGIAGFYNYKTRRPASEEKLAAVLRAFIYRGPDNLGIYSSNDVVMGNVRLAIQGITAEGNQPVYNEDKTVAAVFNGEIYNYPELKQSLLKLGHAFYTNTDTEVLVHLYESYGLDMAKDLNGMFAFAVFDLKKRELVIARDRTAQKPLYINRNAEGVFFASELKAMLPHLDKKELNPGAIRTFLCLGYALEPETVIKSVETIEPGTINVFGRKGESSKRFWRPLKDPSENITDINVWKEEADAVFKRAVKRHLLSDVPVTLLLSGGVDSSLLALYLKDEGRIQKAFTGSFLDRPDHDEYVYAERLGKYCGFDVQRVDLGNKVLADGMEEFLSRASTPQGDYSGIATYCISREVSREYRVVLGGDGGDELFGGYPTYVLPYYKRRYGFVPKSGIRLAHAAALLLSDRSRYMSLPFKLQQLCLAWDAEPAAAHFLIKNFLPDELAGEVLEEPLLSAARGAEEVFEKLYNAPEFTDVVRRLCWIDFNTFLRSQTIKKVERNTMLFSLEGRMPYLDNEMLDLSFRTDASLMVRNASTKYCMRSLLKDKVSGRIELNPVKQGFSPPLFAMLEGELKSWKERCIGIKSPFLRPGLSETLGRWQKNGWDCHRVEWNISALNDWCLRNGLI